MAVMPSRPARRASTARPMATAPSSTKAFAVSEPTAPAITT